MLSSFRLAPLPLLVMERVWLIVAALCLIAAALFLLLWRAQDNEYYLNAAFIAATLGVIAWLLRLRHQLRKTIPRAATVPADEMEETEDEDED